MLSFDEVMQLTRKVSSATAFSDVECRSLYDYCMAVPYGGTVVEIGCQLGRTSSIILQVAKEREYESIHIDPYTSQPEYLVGWIRMMHGIEYPFTFLCMRTEEAGGHIESLCDRRADLVLIDGDHTASAIEKDCFLAAVQLRYPDGVLLAHDYGRESLPDVKATLDRYTQEGNCRLWNKLPVVDTLAAWARA